MTNNDLLRSLRAWVVAGDAFNAAYDIGYASSGTITRHVAELESRMGVDLLERGENGKRTAVLTEAGRDLIGCLE
jgi:DNA-binding transcriptional LysR family regulator